MALTREAILGADDLRRELVKVPEWEGEVWVRELTASERDYYDSRIVDQSSVLAGKPKLRTQDMRALLASLGIIDEDGKRMFGEEDVRALGARSVQALDRIVDVIRRLSGMTEADDEEMASLFGDGPASSASTPSPEPSVEPSRS